MSCFIQSCSSLLKCRKTLMYACCVNMEARGFWGVCRRVGRSHAAGTLNAFPIPYTTPSASHPPSSTRAVPRKMLAPPSCAPRNPKTALRGWRAGPFPQTNQPTPPLGLKHAPGWAEALPQQQPRPLPSPSPPPTHSPIVVVTATSTRRSEGLLTNAAASSGTPAPTVKHSADTTAACSGLAISSMSMPSSSRACALHPQRAQQRTASEM